MEIITFPEARCSVFFPCSSAHWLLECSGRTVNGTHIPALGGLVRPPPAFLCSEAVVLPYKHQTSFISFSTLVWAQLASQVCDFCSHWVPAWEVLMLRWMLCCPQQKTQNPFCTRAFCVHFVLGLANCVVCPTLMHYNTKKIKIIIMSP